MLGISGVTSAGAAADYFAKDNYYSREQSEASSEWYGRGASDQELVGTVEHDDFRNMLEGRFEGEAPTSNTHNPGRDLTFSMPKSASILALVGGDRRIINAYMDAVKEGLSYTEKHLIYTRQRNESGKRVNIKTEHATIALFPHDTNRDQGPNVHIHAVISNGTKTKDGTYAAINFFPLYSVRYELNQIVQERFRHRLHKLGYETYNKDNGGHFEIKGVPQKAIDLFSSRAREIREALKDVVNPNWNQRQSAAYNTRASKGELERGDLQKTWELEVRRIGYDPKALVKTIKAPNENSLWQNIKANMKELYALRYPHSSDKMMSSLAEATVHTIEALSETKTTFNRTQIMAEVSSVTQGGFSPNEIDAQIKRQLRGELVPYKAEINADNKFTTKTLIKAEKEIIGIIERGKNQSPLYNHTVRAQKLIDASELSVRTIDNIETGQKSGAEMILFGRDYLSGTQGYAGSGKTYMLKKVLEFAQKLNADQSRNHSFFGLAPTNAAVDELVHKAGLENAATFQSFQSDTRYLQLNGAKPKREHLAKYSGRIALIDESSMLSVKDTYVFLKAAQKLGVKKIVLLGDRDQIKSLRAGAPFRLLQESGMTTSIVDIIFRQNNPVIRKAVRQTTQHNIKGAFETLNSFVSDHKNPAKMAALKYVDDLSQDIKSMIITPENKTIDQISDEVRRLMREKGLLRGTDHKIRHLKSRHLTDIQKRSVNNYRIGDSLIFHKDVSKGKFRLGQTVRISAIDRRYGVLKLSNGMYWKLDTSMKAFPFDVARQTHKKFAEGDRVSFRIKDINQGVARGMAATILSMTPSTIRLRQEDGSKKTISHNGLAAMGMTHNYASSVYSTQGKDVPKVHLVLFSKALSSTFENFYVGISRAVDYLHIYSDKKSDLRQTIERRNHIKAEHATEHEYSGVKVEPRFKVHTQPVLSAPEPQQQRTERVR